MADWFGADRDASQAARADWVLAVTSAFSAAVGAVMLRCLRLAAQQGRDLRDIRSPEWAPVRGQDMEYVHERLRQHQGTVDWRHMTALAAMDDADFEAAIDRYRARRMFVSERLQVRDVIRGHMVAFSSGSERPPMSDAEVAERLGERDERMKLAAEARRLGAFDEAVTASERIRRLAAAGYDRHDIASLVGVSLPDVLRAINQDSAAVPAADG